MSMPFIPVASPLKQYQAHKHAIDEAISRVLLSGRYILGDEVAGFERVCRISRRTALVAVANGTGPVPCPEGMRDQGRG